MLFVIFLVMFAALQYKSYLQCDVLHNEHNPNFTKCYDYSYNCVPSIKNIIYCVVEIFVIMILYSLLSLMVSLPTVPGTLGIGGPFVMVILIMCMFYVDTGIDKILHDDVIAFIKLYPAYCE